jgi:hypothetical protein
MVLSAKGFMKFERKTLSGRHNDVILSWWSLCEGGKEVPRGIE